MGAHLKFGSKRVPVEVQGATSMAHPWPKLKRRLTYPGPVCLPIHGFAISLPALATQGNAPDNRAGGWGPQTRKRRISRVRPLRSAAPGLSVSFWNSRIISYWA